MYWTIVRENVKLNIKKCIFIELLNKKGLILLMF